MSNVRTEVEKCPIDKNGKHIFSTLKIGKKNCEKYKMFFKRSDLEKKSAPKEVSDPNLPMPELSSLCA